MLCCAVVDSSGCSLAYEFMSHAHASCSLRVLLGIVGFRYHSATADRRMLVDVRCSSCVLCGVWVKQACTNAICTRGNKGLSLMCSCVCVSVGWMGLNGGCCAPSSS